MQTSIENSLKYILIYHKCVSLHSTEQFNHLKDQSKSENTYKDMAPLYIRWH